MIRPLLFLAILLLLGASLSCGSDGPSDSDVKNAIWDYLEDQRGFEWVSGNLRGIEIEQIGKPYIVMDGVNPINIWPVRGAIIWRGPIVEPYDYDVFQNVFDEWKVWPFTIPFE